MAQIAQVPLGRMHQLSEARDGDDDWTGLRDRAERKKRQNRLNQRAWRRRQAESQKRQAAEAEKGPGFTFVNSRDSGLGTLTLTARSKTRDTSSKSSNHESSFSNHGHGDCSSTPAKATWTHGTMATVTQTCCPQAAALQFLSWSTDPDDTKSNDAPHTPHSARLIPPVLLYRNGNQDSCRPECSRHPLIRFPLSPDHLFITLVQYNVLRATIINISVLNKLHIIPPSCDAGLLPAMDDRYSTSMTVSSVPQDLEPTALQKTTPHPGWIDIAPDPKMRDNMILMHGRYDEDELCDDMCGGLYEGFDDCEARGMLVWGDPWKASSWEVTEGFARKWGFLIRGSRALTDATNKWRASRGEDPMDWSVVELDDDSPVHVG